jgi:hypothetical protein
MTDAADPDKEDLEGRARVKAVANVVAYLIALALFMTGTGVSFNTVRTTQYSIENGLFEDCLQQNYGNSDRVCQEVQQPNVGCANAWYVLSAARAFTIISSIVAGVVVLAAVVRLFKRDFLANGLRIPFVLTVITLKITSVIAWILAFDLYAGEFCGKRLSDDFANHVGPSGPVLLVGSCVLMLAMLVEIFIADEGAIKTPEEDAEGKARNKTLFVTFAGIAAATLFVAGVATTFVFFQSTTADKVDYGYFQTCTNINDTKTCSDVTEDSVACTDMFQTLQATRAFIVITACVAGLVVLISTVRLCKPSIIANGFGKFFYRLLFVSTLVSAIIAWALAFSLYGSVFCGRRYADMEHSHVGASGPLVFVGSLVWLFLLGLELSIPDAGTEVVLQTAETKIRNKTIFVIVALVGASMLFFTAAGTAWVEVKSPIGTFTLTFFQRCFVNFADEKQCLDLTSDEITCDDAWKTVQAGRAFTIITSVLAGLIALFAIARLCKPALMEGALKWVYYLVALLTWASSAIAWTVTFGLFASSFCGEKLMDNKDAHVGPSGPCSFVGFIFVFLALCAECLMSTTADAAAAAEPTKEELKNKE